MGNKKSLSILKRKLCLRKLGYVHKKPKKFFVRSTWASNTRTETISQGRVLRLWGTKNKSGSICSVIYLVYLKHATGPTFLNLWNRIKWSPETRTENPRRGLGPKQQKRVHFSHCVTCRLICFHSDAPIPWPTPCPLVFKRRFDQAAPRLVPSALKGSSSPISLPPQQTYYDLECVFRKPLF